MTRGPSKVAVVGRDAELWLSAAALTQAFAATGVEVVAVELPSRLTDASLYATQPPLQVLHFKMGLDEARLLRATGGSFSLGWSISPAEGSPFFLAHGAYGAPVQGGDFFHHWMKATRFGLNVAYEQFSPTAMAARHGRVLLRDEETARFGPTDYGYHLPARAYSALLKEIVCGTGVVVRQATSVAPSINDESGAIRSLLIGGEQLIEADLFVDASGPEAALIGRVGRQVEDWRDFFPFEHFSSSTSAAIEPTPVYADLRLSNEGWTELRASTTATHRVEGDRSGDGGDHESPGVRLGAWSANCVAVGSAACRLDPLFDLDLHALQVSLVQLISLFPRSADADADAERAEYNRATRSHFERIRDFQAALYHLAGFATQLPETLRQRLDAFRARGVIAPMEDETFTADQWRALFLGFGVISESWPPAIDAVSPDVVKQAFRRTLGFVRDKVLAQPTHDELLATRSGPDAAQGDI